MTLQRINLTDPVVVKAHAGASLQKFNNGIFCELVAKYALNAISPSNRSAHYSQASDIYAQGIGYSVKSYGFTLAADLQTWDISAAGFAGIVNRYFSSVSKDTARWLYVARGENELILITMERKEFMELLEKFGSLVKGSRGYGYRVRMRTCDRKVIEWASAKA